METLPLKPFEEMTAADYAEIGFMCGLEVHQQLLTRRKLFCRCPAGHYSHEYDAEILRHMRPTLSEMGEYDGTALMEKKTNKNIFYRVNHETVCTYEFDDTPPFLMDETAIDISMEIAMLLRLQLIDELHIARKQYLDGSIPTGFQRTAIIGIDGWFPFGDGRIRIRQLSIEEDSCREVSDYGHDRTYLTDRLGIPLVEVVTEPDMKTPQDVLEVGRVIRKILLATQKVRRGYGAARQDVNVSVTGGTRIEIKGVPQLWRIPRLVYNEASRQCALLKIRSALHDRGITAETLEWSREDVTDLLGKTRFEPIHNALDQGCLVKCVVLRGFGGLLNTTTQEHTTFVKEFSDRVRVVSCLNNLPNIVCSDTAAESLLAQDWVKIRKRMRAGEQDTLILVWGDERDTESACNEIAIRAKEATEGVPSDTRQALKDGTNGFERVLPGAERMYPDTDLPPIELTQERRDRIRSGLPEDIWDVEQRFRDAGMIESDVQRLCISPYAPALTRIISELNVSGRLLGIVLSQRFLAMKRAGLRPQRLTPDCVFALFKAHHEGRLAREGLVWLLQQILRSDSAESITAERVDAALDEYDIRPLPEDRLPREIDKEAAAVDQAKFPTAAKHRRYLAGRLMRRLVGRVPGTKLTELLGARLAENGVRIAREAGVQ